MGVRTQWSVDALKMAVPAVGSGRTLAAGYRIHDIARSTPPDWVTVERYLVKKFYYDPKGTEACRRRLKSFTLFKK